MRSGKDALKPGCIVVEVISATFLIKHNVITEDQLEECLLFSKQENLTLGKALYKKGYISNSMLATFINKQAEEIVFNMMLWEKGEFEYEDNKLNFDGMMVTHMNVMKVIMGATIRIDEMSVLVKQVPNNEMLFKLSTENTGNEDLELNPKEQEILSFIDGTYTVKQIVEESGIDEIEVYKVLYSLVSSELIEKD